MESNLTRICRRCHPEFPHLKDATTFLRTGRDCGAYNVFGFGLPVFRLTDMS